MNFSRWFLTLILLGFSSSIAMADSVDPKFVPIGGGGSIILHSPNDPAFTFSYLFGATQTVDCGQVSGSFSDSRFTCIDPAHTNTEFVNNSGKAWTSLTLEFTSITGGLTFSPTDNANFIDPYFNNSASGISEVTGNPFVTFFGIDATHPGILAAFGCDGQSCSGPTGTFNDQTVLYYDFSILADVTDAQHAGDAFTLRGSATAVPEPPTVLLALGAGLLLFLFKRP
jgi:hypothetical protein